ncbi:hypothetical protein LP420_26425 [Massilia sp. B-10]|nr:hypothetical protein LP420_26425 [Massilia sp. B-10]UUZ52679.1 hypothetical protein LP419_25900 [Massilia sp. H-1]
MPDTDHDLLSRSERKAVTHRALLNAALTLVGEGRSFSGIALREIARQA